MVKMLRVGKLRLFLALAVLTLMAGTVIGWTTVFGEVERYCDDRGEGIASLLRFGGGGDVTNPLLAPCFWGSIAFVVALSWALYLLLDKDPAQKLKSTRGLWWLLLAGTIFALANNVPVFYDFYTKPVGTVTGCSPDVITNPFLTGCFGGFASFAASFVFVSLAFWAVRRQHKKS